MYTDFSADDQRRGLDAATPHFQIYSSMSTLNRQDIEDMEDPFETLARQASIIFPASSQINDKNGLLMMN